MAEWLRELSAPGLTLDNLWDESNTLGLMPGVLAQRTRVTRDLGHRLAMYTPMRSRPSVPREPSHISETNPNCGLDSADGRGAMTRRHQIQNRSDT